MKNLAIHFFRADQPMIEITFELIEMRLRVCSDPDGKPIQTNDDPIFEKAGAPQQQCGVSMGVDHSTARRTM